MTEATLYERLGGEDKIRAITADILDNRLNNDAVKARYANSNCDEVIRWFPNSSAWAPAVRRNIRARRCSRRIAV